jgi:hypothetical protein
VIQQKLDRLDEASLFPEPIDLTSYSRQRDKLCEELTLAKIEHHTEAVDELDVEHPGVRRTHSAARIRPVGLGLSRLWACHGRSRNRGGSLGLSDRRLLTARSQIGCSRYTP